MENMIEQDYSFDNKSENEKKIDPAKVAITGNIHYPNFGTDQSDTVRGGQALRAIEKVLEKGYGVIGVVTKSTNAEYRKKLEELKDKGRLIVLEEMEKPDAEAHSYGVSKRQAVEESKKQGFPIVFNGELEKEDLLDPVNLEKMTAPLATEKNGQKVGMVVLNRQGIMEKDRNLEENNTIGLPEAQYYGEYSQNFYIWKNWKDAGFAVPDEPYDLLNGTRFTVNEELSVKVDGKEYMVRPSDLMELRYHYQDEDKIGFPYKVDHYSAPTYHSPTMWMALAGENGFGSVELDYQHPQEQTKVEESEEYRQVFEKKRLDQKMAIVLQDFDLCANIVNWKEKGLWPGVVMEAIKNKTPIELAHYDIRDWKLEEGKLVKR
jgi:hypothetical protein